MKISDVAVLGAGVALCCGLVACQGGDAPHADRGLFIQRVSEIRGSSGSTQLHPWIMSHLDVMIAEGGRACRWIARRPSPHDAGDERSAYQAASVRMPELPSTFAKTYQGMFAETAWHSLCRPVFTPEQED